jgi:hypothetical protein
MSVALSDGFHVAALPHALNPDGTVKLKAVAPKFAVIVGPVNPCTFAIAKAEAPAAINGAILNPPVLVAGFAVPELFQFPLFRLNHTFLFPRSIATQTMSPFTEAPKLN